MKERDRDQPFKTNNICFFTVACHICFPLCLCSSNEHKTQNQRSLVIIAPGFPRFLLAPWPTLACALRPLVPLLCTLEQQLCRALARATGKSSIAKVRIKKTKKSNASFAWSSQPSCACEYTPKERGNRGSKN